MGFTNKIIGIKKDVKKYGFIESIITDDIIKFNPKQSVLPAKFSYQMFLSPVTNQCSDPYCVPHSIATWLNWKYNTKHGGVKLDNHIRYSSIYRSKKTQGEGMTFVEAFNYLKTNGVNTDKGIMKIKDVAFIPNASLMKAAILANGPIFGALPVYDENEDMFWVKKGNTLKALHAITIVGWDETGYIIRNSWGTSFGNDGYVVLPYSDANKFRELWTILG